MRQQEETDRRVNPLQEAQVPVRKAYQKPAVRYEKVFETSALSCGKMQSTQGNCRSSRKTS